jgi:hypothetical protein
MLCTMALIEANRLSVSIPAGPDAPPDPGVARARIERWLTATYGYLPPLDDLVAHGWSDSWAIAGRPAPGWRFEAVIPRHLGPSPGTSASSRAHHPARGARHA